MWRGGGRSETNQSLNWRGLGFCAERCHPQTRAAQSTLSSRTDVEAVGETRRQRREGDGLSGLPHTCALRSVRSGQWGGSGFGGKADPEVCQCLVVPQHRPVYTAAFWWWRRGGGGGYLVPPQQLSNAEVPGGQAHGAWNEWFTNTRRPAGGRPHALRPKSTAPMTAAEVGGRNYTHKHVLWKCVCGPASRRGLAHGPRCSGPWTPTALRHIPQSEILRPHDGRGEAQEGARGQKILNKNADARHVQCTGPDQNAWFCTNAPWQQRPRATQHKRSRMHRTFMWCRTGILQRLTDVNELLLFKASLNAFIPSAPMSLSAHEQCHWREPAGNTISGQCCGTTPFTAPHPNTSTAAPTAGPASSSSNPNAQTKTVGTSKICPWVLATDPVKVRSTASLLPSCASPCPVCRGGGKGLLGSGYR